MPAWIRGWSVFTLPPSISGKPVTSSTGVAGTPASTSVAAVLPDETMATPRSDRAGPSSTSPDLSYTDTRARRTGRTSVTFGLLDPHSPTFHLDAPLDERADGPPVQPVLRLVVHQMNRYTGHLGSPPERVLHGVRSREGGQQRRVDVQDPPLVGPDELRPEDPHEARERYSTDLPLLKHGTDRTVVGVPVGAHSGVEEHRLYPGGAGPFQSPRVTMVGYHHAYPRPPHRVIEPRLEVRSLPRRKHRDPCVRPCTHGAARYGGRRASVKRGPAKSGGPRAPDRGVS